MGHKMAGDVVETRPSSTAGDVLDKALLHCFQHQHPSLPTHHQQTKAAAALIGGGTEGDARTWPDTQLP